MTVAIVGLAAFAIDVSRLYVGTNELQTISDASALRGARQLQNVPAQSPVSVTTAFGSENEALGQKFPVAAADVLPIFWDPNGAPQRSVLSGWTNANAVEVSTSRMGQLLFGRFLSAVSPVPQRRAIAWVANIVSVACPAPWGFPIEGLNDVLFDSPDATVRSDLYSRLNTRFDSPSFGPVGLTMVLYPTASTRPTPAGASWPFQSINDQGNPNMNEYADQVAMASCLANANTTIGDSESFPGGGQGSAPRKTADGAFGSGITGGQSMCAVPPSSSKDASCFPRATGYNVGVAGVDRLVSWIGSVSGGAARVLTLGGFRVMCVYRGRPNGNADPAERCAWYDSWRTSGFPNAAANSLPASFPPGTIVGYPVPMNLSLGGTQLGNAPSLAQRLVLVQ